MPDLNFYKSNAFYRLFDRAAGAFNQTFLKQSLCFIQSLLISRAGYFCCPK